MQLKTLPKIQDGLRIIEEIIVNKYYEETLYIERLYEDRTFKKVQNWFKPFHFESEIYTESIESADEDFDSEKFSGIIVVPMGK